MRLTHLPIILFAFAAAVRSEQGPASNGSVQAITLAASYVGYHNNQRVGYCLAGAGDINGDGYDDFIIGSYHHDIDLENWENKDFGGVHLILGKASGFAQNVSLLQADALFESNLSNSAAGWSIGGKGDVNGDGLPDIIIGARHAPYGGQPGYVFLIFGRTQANWGNHCILQNSSDASFVGESNGSCLGTGVDFIGDLNGDGCDGRIYLFKGKKSGWQKNVPVASGADAIIIGDPVPNAEPGYWVRGIGDLNGDGIPDFAVGTMSEDMGGSIPYQTAKVFIFFGRRNIDWGKNFGISYADVIYNEEPGLQWNGSARHVAPAGDVNRDGYDDLLVNAPKYPTGTEGETNFNKGKTYVIFGRPTAQWVKNNDLRQSSASFLGQTNGDWSGYGINGELDLNGDGYGDFLVGAIQHDPSGRTTIVTGPGKVYWIKGSASGWSNNVSLNGISDTFSGQVWQSGFGWAVSPIGDFNQDGAQDFAVSAPFYNTQDYSYPIGKIYVYFGEKTKPLIKGSVLYWKNNKAVQKAVVKKDGTTAAYTFTPGNYFLGVTAGSNPVISIARDHGAGLGDTTVTSYDAALTARCAIGSESLTGYPRKAADINNDGAIGITDALQIARYAVHLEGAGATKAGDWYFEPSQRAYTNVQSDQTGQNYTAVIRGDVDGGWASGSAKSSADFAGALASEALLDGDTLRVALSLKRAVPLLSFDVALAYDQGLWTYCGNRVMSAGDAFTVLENAERGLLRLGGFAVDDRMKNGGLLEAVFAARKRTGDAGFLKLHRAELNQTVVERDADLAVVDLNSPQSFGLAGNYPNPFNGSTVIHFIVPTGGELKLDVLDIRGACIKTLNSEPLAPGRHSLIWDGLNGEGRAVPSGTYIIRLVQGNRMHCIKVLLLK
jgi:hypothetical protein